MMQEKKIVKKELLVNSRLSFTPLLAALKKSIREGHPGMQKLYGQVLKDFELHPELLSPITDLSLLNNHTELIEELLSAVFPPTTANYMYGVSIPFKNISVYASPLFKIYLLSPGSNEIQVPDEITRENLQKESQLLAAGLILKKYLGYINPDIISSFYPYEEPETGITRYMELRTDIRFIDVHPAGEMPFLPESLLDPQSNRLFTIDELMEKIPVEKFIFDGITPVRVNDITETAVISEIKNRLLGIKSLPEAAEFEILKNFIQSLIGLKELSIGITPFFKINDHYIYADLHYYHSILFKGQFSPEEKDEISDYCKLLFRENDQPVLYDIITEDAASQIQCLKYYYEGGGRSLILCPLKQGDELIGMLEIITKIPARLKPVHISKIKATIPLFTLGLEKTLEQLNNKVDNIIKKKFTAVQPAVEWKFTETALNYIVSKMTQEDVKIEKIVFDNVYPLYGSIDVRNSSIERSYAIQQDMLEQLSLTKAILKEAQAIHSFPLLQEIEFKNEQHFEAASDILQAEEELSIQGFFQEQVIPVLNHLKTVEPSLADLIQEYFKKLNPESGMIHHHRNEYEKSISRINETLSGFLDKEHEAAQKVYPHYFERNVTDGLDFNIFIGQSITPRKKFDEIYLRNLKMWQLTILTKGARITRRLEKELSHLLRTTQLILCHSQPLSISFRSEERKFDVDGAYNTRYEIVKKRIDKVRIKNTNERLTQPGKIAIVYSQSKEAAEYTEYIEFLQNKKLLLPGIEQLELEELQGVIGLKALRVDICFDDNVSPAGTKKEISATTYQ
jgi:hypothetical protein